MQKNRKEELIKLFEGTDEAKEVVYPLIDEVIFLEEQLDYLKTLPFIRVNPDNPSLQKPTTASKQYKDYLQQYNNCLKTLISAIRKGASEEESPLREFFRKYNG